MPRNVARLVELPTWEPGAIVPWSSGEAIAFLQAAADDPLNPAFVLPLLYGMRRGEVLGLRWADIDTDAGLIPGPPADPAHPGPAAHRPR